MSAKLAPPLRALSWPFLFIARRSYFSAVLVLSAPTRSPSPRLVSHFLSPRGLRSRSAEMGDEKKPMAATGVWPTVKPFANGGASGMLATCVIQPIDMVKVRPACSAHLRDLVSYCSFVISLRLLRDRSESVGACRLIC